MKAHEIFEYDSKYIIHTYKRTPVIFVKGKKCFLWDIHGKQYLDFVSGLAVNNIGHCNFKVTSAIRNQSYKLMHVSNLYYTVPSVKLAKELCRISFAQKCFFCNSGAEANEATIKLTRKYAKTKFGENKHTIITFSSSFHGRTMGTLTATAQEKFHKGYEPLLPGFKYANFNDIESAKNLIDENTAGIMVEPIQGEGGVNIATQEFIQGLRELCDKNNLLLIFDEVQTGIGRTGAMFAYEHYKITPDIMTLAKAIGGGLPLGVMLTKDTIAEVFDYGSHASTFGANPVVCADAIAVLNIIQKEKLIKNAKEMGEYFLSKLQNLKAKYNKIVDVRGLGLMIAVELNSSGEKIVEECMKEGLIINLIGEKIIRFLPPLIVTKKEIDKAINILNKVGASLLAQ